MTEQEKSAQREAFETAKRELLEAWGRAEREEESTALRHGQSPDK